MRALLTTEAPARTLTLAPSAALPPSHLSRALALRVNLVRPACNKSLNSTLGLPVRRGADLDRFLVRDSCLHACVYWNDYAPDTLCPCLYWRVQRRRFCCWNKRL